MININEIHEAIELIPNKSITPPCGPDFRLLLLATPVLFFNKELNESFPIDFKKYCETIKEIHNTSPRIKRLPMEWNTPLNIRNKCYGLMEGKLDFDPDNEEIIKEMPGKVDKIPKVKIY